MKLKTLLLSSAYPRETGTGWKTDDDGNIVLKDGNPVYLDSSGSEMVVKSDTIRNLNAEAKSLRESRDEAQKKLEAYDGLDADIARKAVEQMGKIDAKQLIDAGKVDELKAQIQSEYQKQLDEKDGLNSTLQSQLDGLRIDSIFNNSDFARDSIAVPHDMFQSFFRNNFKVEDGKVVAYDKAGNRMMSKQNVGEYATPDEALRLLVESHPQKDVILRADVGNGTGSDGSGGNRGTGRIIKRSDFEKLPPSKQSEFAQKIGSGEMTLTE